MRAGGSTDNSSLMFRSSQFAGMPIQDASGNVTGKVVDFIGDSNGNSRFAVVSLSGDSRNIVVPVSALGLQANSTGSGVATLRLAPQQLQNAPGFSGSSWPNFGSQQFLNGFNTFYQPLLPGQFNSAPNVPASGTPSSGDTAPQGNGGSPSLFPGHPASKLGPAPRSGPRATTRGNSGASQLFPGSAQPSSAPLTSPSGASAQPQDSGTRPASSGVTAPGGNAGSSSAPAAPGGGGTSGK